MVTGGMMPGRDSTPPPSQSTHEPRSIDAVVGRVRERIPTMPGRIRGVSGRSRRLEGHVGVGFWAIDPHTRDVVTVGREGRVRRWDPLPPVQPSWLAHEGDVAKIAVELGREARVNHWFQHVAREAEAAAVNLPREALI